MPDPIDLLVSKQETGRDKDQTDIIFLEGKIQADYLARLPQASMATTVTMPWKAKSRSGVPSA